MPCTYLFTRRLTTIREGCVPTKGARKSQPTPHMFPPQDSKTHQPQKHRRLSHEQKSFHISDRPDQFQVRPACGLLRVCRQKIEDLGSEFHSSTRIMGICAICAGVRATYSAPRFITAILHWEIGGLSCFSMSQRERLRGRLRRKRWRRWWWWW